MAVTAVQRRGKRIGEFRDILNETHSGCRRIQGKFGLNRIASTKSTYSTSIDAKAVAPLELLAHWRFQSRLAGTRLTETAGERPHDRTGHHCRRSQLRRLGFLSEWLSLIHYRENF